MTSTVTTGLWQRFDRAEHALCVRANRGCHYILARRLFVTVSRLGDGIFWYVLMLAFALSGPQGALVATQMAVAGLAGTALYRQLKHRLVRERPFISYLSIQSGTAPLDRYSFPSGHTLHAVSFTLIATTHVPELALLLVPFALLVAASRVVLGLHYPTDVLAGAAIGAAVGRAVVSFWPV